MKKFIIAALAFAPAFAFAQQLTNVSTLFTSIGHLINLALPIVVGLALLAFFWGMAMFIFNANDEEKRKEARSTMIYGIIALFVMVAVWGLVQFVGNALGVQENTSSGSVPTVTGLPQ